MLTLAMTARALALLATGLAIAAGFAAMAQTRYPNRTVQLVIPYPPGGSDALARRLVIGLGEKLGQPVVVVNVPGASTQVASQKVVNAQPDGYYLYFAAAAELAAGPSLFKSLPFDPLQDFTFISYVAEAPYTLLVSSALGIKTYAELVAVMKADPGKLRFGSYGINSQPDVLARLLNLALGTNIQIVPYQGGAPALNAVVRGEVNLLFATLIPGRPFIQSKQMIPLAIASSARVPLLPDVPTMREHGVDMGMEIVGAASFSLAAPKGLAPEIVSLLHKVLVDELANPETRKFIEGLGVVPIGSTPEAFRVRLEKATRHWAEFAPKLGLEKQ